MSPVVDASTFQSLTLEFKHMVDWYASPMTVGVATRANATDTWTTVWSVNPTANINATTVSQVIQNDDLQSSTFQFCFFFTGNLYNLDYWYIDDVKLFYPEEHDMATMLIAVDAQYEANTPVSPVVTYKNVGMNNETAEAFCKIYQYDQLVYTQSQSITVNAGATQQVTFPAFTPAVANEMYKVEAYTVLATDTDDSNNMIFTWFDTYNNPRQKVILEIGTGTWCPYCPGAAMGADDLHNNGQEVGVIEYHNGDTYVTTTGTARLNYYGVTGFPTSIFDGGASIVGGSNNQSLYNQFLPIYNASYAKKTPLNITIDGQLSGNDLSVNVTVDRFGRFLNSDAVLHFAITESGIAQNWQGQTVLDFVERNMLPNADGTPINLVSNESVTIPLSTTLGANWNHEEIELVAVKSQMLV
ncbi:MAG TPA: Omp28-related outer membrane protein [Candidatus Cloacimonadota bacterium]|nr:Omp28-related outer membrane protein [Candidatus Cloacimonadota bacterium]